MTELHYCVVCQTGREHKVEEKTKEKTVVVCTHCGNKKTKRPS